MSYVMHEETIGAQGLKFEVTIEADEHSSFPWEECDGFGIVREGTRSYWSGYLDKRPGEIVLYAGDRNERTWLYDWAATLKRAKKDWWGLGEKERPANWDTLTKGQQLECIVKRDYEFLKAWCDEEWVWSGVRVKLVDYEGELDLERSLWSVEFWQYESLDSKRNSYICEEVIEKMTREIAETYHKEEAERRACEERDIVTV